MIQIQYVPDSYSGNGIATSFAFNWPILRKQDLVAKTKIIATGVVVNLALDVDYSIADGDVGVAAGGGDVVLGVALPTGTNLYLQRETALTQLENFIEAGAFPAATMTTIADRLTMMIQETKWKIRTALKFADTSSFVDINVPDPVDGTFLGWLNNLLINTSQGQLGAEIDVTTGAASKLVSFAAPMPNTNYTVVGLTTNWNTTANWSLKTVNNFTVTFGTQAPAGAKLTWRVNP